MIVRLDAIGDYILFRNCLAVLKSDNRFKKYSFTLLGNEAFKDLAEEFDYNCIDSYIWVHPDTLLRGVKNNEWHAFLQLLKLKLVGFDVLINPVHSKFPELEKLIQGIGAKRNIGSAGDSVRLQSEQQLKAINSFYNELIEVPGVDCFEFLRNKAFTETLTKQLATNVSLSVPPGFKENDLRGETIVIFPGAGLSFRRWSASHFAELILLINSEYKNFKFSVMGSKGDTILANEIVASVAMRASVQIEDRTGKTSLVELVRAIQAACLLISNETSAVHMAASADTPVVCISNGNHFGRFNPYPKEMNKEVYTIYPDESFYTPSLFADLVKKYQYKSDIDINLIQPETVFGVVSTILKK